MQVLTIDRTFVVFYNFITIDLVYNSFDLLICFLQALLILKFAHGFYVSMSVRTLLSKCTLYTIQKMKIIGSTTNVGKVIQNSLEEINKIVQYIKCIYLPFCYIINFIMNYFVMLFWYTSQ